MSRFYAEGLRFECTGCRYCCGVEPGFVFLTEQDLINLYEYTGLNSDEFQKKYCRKVPVGGISYISLQETKDYDCIFLTEKGCGVYQSRPVQCRAYPFWASILEDRQAWERESASCPGIGKGKLHAEEEILSILALREGCGPMVV
jgi:hypothetical protein